MKARRADRILTGFVSPAWFVNTAFAGSLVTPVEMTVTIVTIVAIVTMATMVVIGGAGGVDLAYRITSTVLLCKILTTPVGTVGNNAVLIEIDLFHDDKIVLCFSLRISKIAVYKQK